MGEEKGYAKGDTPKRPTRPSEALKKAWVSTPASVMGMSAKDWIRGSDCRISTVWKGKDRR